MYVKNKFDADALHVQGSHYMKKEVKYSLLCTPERHWKVKDILKHLMKLDDQNKEDTIGLKWSDNHKW